MSDGIESLENMLETERAKPRRRRSKTALAALSVSVVPWASLLAAYGLSLLFGWPGSRAICWFPEYHVLKIVGLIHVVFCGFAVLIGIFCIGWVRLNREHVYGMGYGVMAVVHGLVVLQMPNESGKCILGRIVQ